MFMFHLSFLPLARDEYLAISVALRKADRAISTDFHGAFVPNSFFTRPSGELIRELERQGELLNDPDWVNDFYRQAEKLPDEGWDGWQDLPADIQHQFFAGLPERCQQILLQYLPNAGKMDAGKPFLPSMRMPQEQLSLCIALRQHLIEARLAAAPPNLELLRPLESLGGKEVYFWGCGATYKKYRPFLAGIQARCILVDLPDALQSVDGIPVRHPAELEASAQRLPVLVFTRKVYLPEIREKLRRQYNLLVEGEPVWITD
jgi:hypothetical protein